MSPRDRSEEDSADDDWTEEERLARLDTDDLTAAFYVRGQINALGEIWRRHYIRMRRMARQYLSRYRESILIYEADDALSEAAAQMTRQALAGGLADKVTCRNEFWLFFRNVLRQCIRDEADRQAAIKRGGGASRQAPPEGRRRRGLLGLRGPGREEPDDLDLVASRERGPEVIAATAEVIDRLFDLLDDEQRVIATLLLSEVSVRAIAEEMKLSQRTIARRAKEIRRIWGQSGLLG